MAKSGIDSLIVNPIESLPIAEQLLSGCRAAIFGKLSLFDSQAFLESARSHLAIAARAQATGVQVIADVCEDRFDHPLLGGYWKDLLRIADKVVAATETLAELVEESGGRDIHLISDPVEGSKNPPAFMGWTRSPDDGAADMGGAASGRGKGDLIRPLRLLWIGHQSNIDEVTHFLPNISQWAESNSKHVQFAVVTASGFGIAEMLTDFLRTNKFVSGSFVEWSNESAIEELRNCDLVAIPATLQNARKRSKSVNRLCQGLHAGRFVLACPVPSYLDFAAYAWIGNDLCKGLDWALANPAVVLERIDVGQSLIEREYSPAAITAKWARLLRH